MIEKPVDYFKFRCQDLSFAVKLDSVIRVIRAVAVTRPSDLPPYILGVFNYYETPVPLLSVYGKRQTGIVEPEPDQFFILVKTPVREMAILADTVDGIYRPEEKDTTDARSVDANFNADRVFFCDHDIVFIYDIEKFIDSDDEIRIGRALEMMQTDDRP